MAENCKESPRHSLQFQAQVRNYEQKLKSNGLYLSLNHHGTPPQSIACPVNPFRDKDPEKLLNNISSPDLVENAVSPSVVMQNLPEFAWTLEEIARINPANIESPQALLDESIDEESEQEVQRAVNRYFEESHNVQTPEDFSMSMDFMNRSTPDESMSFLPIYGNSSSTPRVSKSHVTNSTQMEVSRYSASAVMGSFNYSFEEDEESFNSSSKRISLRRKLFNHGESPIKSDDENVVWKQQRTEWSPTETAAPPFLSSPLLSPIQNVEPVRNTNMIFDPPLDMQDTGYES